MYDCYRLSDKCLCDVEKETTTNLSPGSGEIVIQDRLIRLIIAFVCMLITYTVSVGIFCLVAIINE